MPDGLVISSDMQKGLQNAIENVYPLAEHRECMRHLFSNFKSHYHGDLFKFGLWGAARMYSLTHFAAVMKEIEVECSAFIQYLNKEHNKLWSRSKFGTIAKCDNLTNNIAETFNNWIFQERDKPIVELIDSIGQKIMVRFE
jgi:transposase-like protein